MSTTATPDGVPADTSLGDSDDTTGVEPDTEAEADPAGDADAEPDDDPADTADADQDDDGHSPNREAARYRRQLRATEAERDALALRVGHLQVAEVERLATDALAQPHDLFDVGGVLLHELVNDDGDVDPELVQDAVAQLLEQRPGLARIPKLPIGPSTTGLGSTRGGGGGGMTWQDLLRRE